MHIEVLTEDSSGEKLIDILLPKIIGNQGDPHTWKLHGYKGVGRLPTDLSRQDPAKRALLEQLPRLLSGYGKTPHVDAVVVVVDSDNRNCKKFLQELNSLLSRCDSAPPKTLFRLAIEEIEAWLLGDQPALRKTYPRIKQEVLKRYKQDSICGTWEVLADAVHPGGARTLKKASWPLPGKIKHEWAEMIGPHMDIENNQSPSFCKFRDGLRRLTSPTTCPE
jgi:hypothetical protein